jgi:hypothetical protein
MTKRLMSALVALALFVLLAIMPVSAVTTTNPNGTQIDLGATIFIGEQGLNLTHALNGAYTGANGAGADYDCPPANMSIGWWASAAQITTTSPSKTINLQTRYKNFQVAPEDFVGFTGNWYALGPDGTTASPYAVMNVQDPSLSIGVWDFQQSTDVTGRSVPQGEHLGIQVNTNLYAATYPNRNNSVWAETGYAPLIGANYNVMPNGLVSS